jgi:PKD repeat protein
MFEQTGLSLPSFTNQISMRIIASVIMLFVCGFAQAQVSDLNYCGTTEKSQAKRNADPSIWIQQEQLSRFVKEWVANHEADLRDEELYVIPIVFHVIHDYGYENLSDDQVKDAVRILNEDFRKLNADTSQIVEAFKGIAGDSKIEFRLANKAPDGSCTNGIEHIQSMRTYAGDDNAKLNPWPRGDYLNIWTVKSLEDGIAGYAYFPSDVNGNGDAAVDGVIILASYVGSIGSGSTLTSRALTHEIGHSLGLPHTWGYNNSPGIDCGDDDIDDTPITEGWVSCNLSASTCTPGVIENVQNYMEYAYCSNMFTEDQGLAMQGVLNHSTAQRNSLWTTDNLILTGTEDESYALCAPIADFYTGTRMACVGAPITFYDVSTNGTVENRTWTFEDGEPASSDQQNPQVSFASPGWKTITLAVSNAQGEDVLARSYYVFISSETADHVADYLEAFEDPNVYLNEWLAFNPAANNSSFVRTATAGYQSSASVKLSNYHSQDGDLDQLISPSFDLSSGQTRYLNFRYSCATNTTNSSNINDRLSIYTSSDCGKTWLIRTSIIGQNLANAGYFSGSYTPTSVSQWEGKSILLPSTLYDPNLRFKFEFRTNGYGNNLYLDDIHVSSYPVGVHDPDAGSFSMGIFPNPVNEHAVLKMHQLVTRNVSIRIVDVSGRMVSSVFDGLLTEGDYQFALPVAGLPSAGVYLLIADDGLTIQREKLIVQ